MVMPGEGGGSRSGGGGGGGNFQTWPDQGWRGSGTMNPQSVMRPDANEALQVRAVGSRDPREIAEVQAKLAAKQREKAFALANLKATLDREYEDAVKSLGARASDPNAVNYGVGGPWGVPVSWIGFGR